MTKVFRPLAVAGITLLSWSHFTVGVLRGGEQEYTAVVSRKCTPWRERNTSTAPQNLAGFLEPARHGGESPWDIIPTALPVSLCVCVCVCVCKGGTQSCKRARDVRVCASVYVLQWLHAGCWKQPELVSAWCHGNFQRSSLSLVFSSTVGAYRSDIIGYTLYSVEPGPAPSCLATLWE